MMKRVVLALSISMLLLGTRLMLGQGGNPFIAHNDRGETVHVLPPPAAVRFPGDSEPIVALKTGGLAVYKASYGTRYLLDHGGLEIAGAAFQAIYWNSDVANAGGAGTTSLSYSTIQAELNAFASVFADNVNYSESDRAADYTIVQQYGSRSAISNSLNVLSPFVDIQPTRASISDSAIQSYLASLLDAGHVTASSSTIYGVYFPQGMTVTMGGGASCSTFCGYHGVFSYSGTQIKYAAFPYLNCSACKLSSLTVADMLTIVSSHEIREAVTDPGDNGSHAWYDAAGYEADDKCAWHHLYQMINGGFWVQPEYSNGGTVTRSGFTATYPGPGCIVP